MTETGGPWVAHYWRHHVECHDEFETSADAVSFLEYGEDEGSLTTWGVIRPDGTEVLCPYRGGDEDEWTALRTPPERGV